ncbi:hypothetical protein JTE90_028301 [Oedothorax gibbosus]|uniref:Uncharacterized protein n=1 Tax=Oedothorax gibbosus TaxID=931172 RepID=A0AAV6TE31_9ARAC|nr:hypothetical protein JTE90_028301 [Oedothorax gibbosus]
MIHPVVPDGTLFTTFISLYIKSGIFSAVGSTRKPNRQPIRSLTKIFNRNSDGAVWTKARTSFNADDDSRLLRNSSFNRRIIAIAIPALRGSRVTHSCRKGKTTRMILFNGGPHVWPRKSKGITDLLLLLPSCGYTPPISL